MSTLLGFSQKEMSVLSVDLCEILPVRVQFTATASTSRCCVPIGNEKYSSKNLKRISFS